MKTHEEELLQEVLDQIKEHTEITKILNVNLIYMVQLQQAHNKTLQRLKFDFLAVAIIAALSFFVFNIYL